VRLSWPARGMGEPGSPRGLCAGWQAQGKKVSLPPLRFRRSRRSRPSARSSQSEARCSRALNSIWETCQLAIGPRKRSRIPGEGKENMARRKAPPCPRNRPHPTRGAGHRWVKVCRGDHLSPAKHARAHEIPVMRRPVTAPIPTEQTMEPSSHLVVTTAPSADEVGPTQHHVWTSGVCPLSTRAQAVPPGDDGADDGKCLRPPFRRETAI